MWVASSQNIRVLACNPFATEAPPGGDRKPQICPQNWAIYLQKSVFFGENEPI